MTPTEKQKKACDRTITKAGRTMISSIGASPEMMLDRLLTFAAAHMVSFTSKEEAAEAFRRCADAVESGIFDHLEDVQRH
ncbi:hypothetical protein [Paracoccus beibuensis]|uniref:hypothetical protein n=1 Tax=Paracoccus beibuensis TaxID=547602 RepID=UPI00223FF197|nr:hypothetical protein [Paracoccus beibuensis]